MSNKLLVIGSNSFSGSHFAAGASFSDYEVLGVSRSNRPKDCFLPETWNISKKSSYKFRQADLNEISRLNSIIKDFKPNYVVNFAAQGMVAESWDAPLDWYRTNLLAQVELHQILRNLDSLSRYIHVTTPEVYGSTVDWINEDQEFNPSTPYAASRAACDLHLRTFHSGFNFPVVFTRAANVYGPGQQLYRVIPKAILACISGTKMFLHGGGKSMRSFLHIDDMVEATLNICKSGNIGETYHISDHRLITIKSLIEKIANRFDLSLEEIATITAERLGKDDSYMLSAKKLKEQFNWKPRNSLDDGLKETIEWVQKNYSDLKKLPWSYTHKK